MDHFTAQVVKYEQEEEGLLAQLRADYDRLEEITKLKDACKRLMQVWQDD